MIRRMTLLPLFGAALLVAACGGKEEAKVSAPPVVNVDTAAVVTVSTARVTDGPRLSGTLQPQQSATITAEVGGTVTAVNTSEGSSVGAGSVLAVISDETASESVQNARTAVQSAQTAVAVARRDQDRSSSLASAGAVPRRDVDVARAQVANAQSQLAQAQQQLTQAQKRASDQRVTTSMTGIVSEKLVSAGDVVSPGAPLFTIVDLGTLQLEASVTSEAVSMLRPGSSVDVEVRGYASERFRGTITRVAPTVDAGTGQVRVYVSIANEGRRLVGGLFAEGTVTTVARNGLVIPIGALDETGDTPAVLRLRPSSGSHVAERVVVDLGVRNESAGMVEVISGLQAGDRILTGPARTITPGTRVNVETGPAAATTGS